MNQCILWRCTWQIEFIWKVLYTIIKKQNKTGRTRYCCLFPYNCGLTVFLTDVDEKVFVQRQSLKQQSPSQRNTASLPWIQSCPINNEKWPQISSTPAPAVPLWDARQIASPLSLSLSVRSTRNSRARLLALHGFCYSEFVALHAFPVVFVSVQQFQMTSLPMAPHIIQRLLVCHTVQMRTAGRYNRNIISWDYKKENYSVLDISTWPLFYFTYTLCWHWLSFNKGITQGPAVSTAWKLYKHV